MHGQCMPTSWQLLCAVRVWKWWECACVHVVQGCSCCQCSLPQFLLFEQSFCFRIMVLWVWNGFGAAAEEPGDLDSSHEPQPKRQAGGYFLNPHDTLDIPSSWQSFFSQDLSELNQAELLRVSRVAACFEKCYGESSVSQLAMPAFDERRAALIYSGARQTQSRHWQPSPMYWRGKCRIG